MISRKLEKAGFSSRKIAPIVFIKASIEHILLKKSWRQIAAWLPCSHLPIFNFYQNFKNNGEFQSILFTLAKRRIFLNIKGKNSISQDDINNNEEILELTLKSLKDILKDV